MPLVQAPITRNDQLTLKAKTGEGNGRGRGRGRACGRGRGGPAAAKSSSSKGTGDGWTQEEWASWTAGEAAWTGDEDWTEQDWAAWTGNDEDWTEQHWAGDEDWTEEDWVAWTAEPSKKKGKRKCGKKAAPQPELAVAPQPEPAVKTSTAKPKAKARSIPVARASRTAAPIIGAGADDSFDYPLTFARRSCPPIQGSEAALAWRAITRSFWEQVLPGLSRGERTVAEAGLISRGSRTEVLWQWYQNIHPSETIVIFPKLKLVRPATGSTLASAGCKVSSVQVMRTFSKS